MSCLRSEKNKEIDFSWHPKNIRRKEEKILFRVETFSFERFVFFMDCEKEGDEIHKFIQI